MRFTFPAQAEVRERYGWAFWWIVLFFSEMTGREIDSLAIEELENDFPRKK